MTDELNLKDPAVIERLKAADVSKQAQPDVEAVATEKALKENKPKKVTLELSTAEVQKLTLLAAKAN